MFSPLLGTLRKKAMIELSLPSLSLHSRSEANKKPRPVENPGNICHKSPFSLCRKWVCGDIKKCIINVFICVKLMHF